MSTTVAAVTGRTAAFTFRYQVAAAPRARPIPRSSPRGRTPAVHRASCFELYPRVAFHHLTPQASPETRRRASPRWSSSSASPPPNASNETATTTYTFDDIRARLPTAGAPAVPDPSPSPLILIDVREPAELTATGRIPTAHNVPISSFPDGPFLPPDEFHDKFGFEKPAAGAEVVFYCKSGVRSRAAARMMAPEWGKQGVRVGEFPGSWSEWAGRGGEVEK